MVIARRQYPAGEKAQSPATTQHGIRSAVLDAKTRQCLDLAKGVSALFFKGGTRTTQAAVWLCGHPQTYR